MTDRILVWFQCANPQCPYIHNKINKNKGTHSRQLPISFMTYVTGRLEFLDYKTSLQVYDDDLVKRGITEIVLYVDSNNPSDINSYLYPIKGIMYCSVCWKIISNNQSMEEFI